MSQLLLMGIPKDAEQEKAMREVFNEVGNKRSYILPHDADVIQTLHERIAAGHRPPHLIFASYARFPEAFAEVVDTFGHLKKTPMVISHEREDGIADNLRRVGMNVILARRPEILYRERSSLLTGARTVVGEFIRRCAPSIALGQEIEPSMAESLFEEANTPWTGKVYYMEDRVVRSRSPAWASR